MLVLWFAPSVNAQTGKDGSVVISSDAILNSYTKVIADASIGDTLIQCINIAQLTDIEFGDLVVIIQMQGASISTSNDRSWGTVSSLNNAGNYEYAYIQGVDTSNNTLELCSPLTKNYSISGNVQVVKIPQYTDLTINGGVTITGESWNGITGGIVAIHATGTVTVNGEISTEGLGFRGGVRDNETSGTGAAIVSTYRSSDEADGAEKGESIAGFYEEYDAANGRYSRGAPANGGGGGNGHNAGGGGGANGGALTNWNGYGVMNTSSTGFTAYQLDPGYTVYGNYTVSTGGGQGGYTYASNNENALSVGPGQAAWGGDFRDTVGGVGGRPIDGYALNDRIFFGGGGGAGDGNNTASYNGANGGGIILISADQVTGSGTLNADGADGNTTLNGGNDAPGGGGGGGSILVDAATSITNLTINARGGTGGNQVISNNESEGNGGGGGGGVIATTAPSTTSLTKSAIGGEAGTSNSLGVTEFPKNGATDGQTGVDNGTISFSIPTYSCSTPDRDGDGGGDYGELDTDNDGIPNSIERSCTITAYVGDVGAVTSQTGITNSANIVGAANSTYANFDAVTDVLTVQLEDELPYGSIINIVWKKANGTGPGAEMKVEISTDNLTYEEHEARYFRTTSTTAETITFPLTSATEYIRISQSYAEGSNFNFDIDAIYYTYSYRVCVDADSDGDGIVDYLDLDSDNDGIPDIIEAGGVDSNGDGVIDYPTPGDPSSMTDTDNDGLADVYDSNNGGTNIPLPDTDGDGIKDYLDLDADGDGIPDLVEAGGVDSDGDGRVDVDVSNSANDADRDGYADIYDSDDDGTPGVDAGEATAPLVLTTDSGSDGLYDAMTNGSGTSLDSDGDGYTDALDLDADNDGIPDIIEANGVDSDGNGRVDTGTDADGDGLADIYDSDASDGPSGTGTNGSALVQTDGTDTNGDYKANDAAIVFEHGDGTVLDSDGDGLPDYLDLDADQDGLPDIVEAGGVDSDGDGRTDSGTDVDQDGLVDIFDSNANDGPGGTGTNGSALVKTGGTDTDADGIADDVAIVWEHGNGTDIDADGDGLPEYIDLDADNDGIPDIVEAGGVDSNGNGRVDISTDADGDGDGLADIYDSNASDGPAGTGTNGVSLVQTNGTDTGSDGLADGDSGVGYRHGGSATDIDTDGDNIQDWLDIDADNDGVPDLIEAGGLDANGNGYVDLTTDADNDGLVDAYDSDADDGPGGTGTNGTALVQTGGTDTGSDGLADGDAAVTYQNGSGGIWPDWDGDGVPNHLDRDADNDGIADIIESGGVDADGDGIVDGVFTDTDNDGFSNTFDTDNSGTAIISTGADTDFDNLPDSYSDDTDTDVHPNFADVDADNDGILDNLEAQTTAGYSPAGSTDTDGDGILDEYDGGSFLIPTNTGGASVADYLDVDSDGDGLLDKHEAWDRHDDGDGVIDLTCSADSDDDGLLDCYDSDSGDPNNQTVGVTPPTDNGFDGTGYTNSSTSTGSTAEDLFPNNGGVEAQPDWRDADNCSLSPSLVYPITGTGYLFSTGTHSPSAATTGTIRSTAFCDDAVEAGYTYYYPAIEPDKVLFAIDHASNSNDTKVDYVELRRDEAANRMAKSGSQGHFVMGRDWFVQTIDDAALTGNVNVRFYFDPADSTAIADSAANFATKWGTTLETPKWFKVDDAWNNGDISAGDGLSGLAGYVELAANYGTEGGLHYVQFNNISGFSGGGMIIEVTGTLPVELTEFKAVAKEADAILSWITATEENTDRFEIEKSEDGNQFETIGQVQAAGTSLEAMNYAFTDKNAGLQNRDRWIYRLKMIDLDGSFSYSQLAEANWVNEWISSLEIFPNPASEQINIRYATNTPAKIQIFDLQGRKIWQQSISKEALEGNFVLDISSWSDGIYSFRLLSKDMSQNMRFIKR